jgi:hypothetical protein
MPFEKASGKWTVLGLVLIPEISLVKWIALRALNSQTRNYRLM